MGALGVVALDQIFLTSAADSTGRSSVDILNQTGANGLILYFNCTAAPGSPTGVLNVVMEAKDPATNNYVQITPNFTGSNAISTATTKVYYFGLGTLTASSAFAGTANTPLPRIFRITVKNAASQSYTYSIGGTLVPA
jgi:hypothetical protein